MWPNASKFDPERWLTGETAPSQYTFPVFNAGPRRCLGMRMAMVEIAMLTSMILQRFTIKPTPGMCLVDGIVATN